MKRTALLLAGLLVCSVPAPAQTPAPAKPAAPRPAAPRPARAATPAAPAMTNQDVIDMVAAGLSDDVIVTAIRQATKRSFSLTAPGLIALKRGKVSDPVIRAMQEDGAVASKTPDPTPPAPSRQPPAAAAAAPVAAPAPRPAASVNVILTDGTPIKVRSPKGLSSKNLKAGEAIAFEVADDVTVDGRVVIQKGSAASGKVTQATKPSLTHYATLEFGIESVKAVNGEDLRVRATQGADPTSGLVTIRRGEVRPKTEFIAAVKGNTVVSVPRDAQNAQD